MVEKDTRNTIFKEYFHSFKYLSDDYKDFSKLGLGGFGMVVKAFNILGKRWEAIKIIKVGYMSEEELKLMECEVQIGINCEHEYTQSTSRI